MFCAKGGIFPRCKTWMLTPMLCLQRSDSSHTTWRDRDKTSTPFIFFGHYSSATRNSACVSMNKTNHSSAVLQGQCCPCVLIRATTDWTELPASFRRLLHPQNNLLSQRSEEDYKTVALTHSELLHKSLSHQLFENLEGKKWWGKTKTCL